MQLNKCPAIFILTFPWFAFAQNGGRSAFEYINMPISAHIAGVGGINTSLYTTDINMITQNPALLHDTMNKQLSASYIPYFSTIKASALSYAQRIATSGMWGGSLLYVDYGTIPERDEGGNDVGEFKPYEMVFTISKSHRIDAFTMGANIKYALSKLYPLYSAHALFFDAGGIFRHPERDLTVSLVVKNAGFAFKKYQKGTSIGIPFDVQSGLSYKFEHMPMRISITAHHLHRPDIVYLDTVRNRKVDLDGNVTVEKKKVIDLIGTHFVVGPEIIFSKNLQFRFGYNYMRRYEMRLQQRSAVAGLSWGFMIAIKSLRIEFARAYYHVAHGRNWFTLAYHLNSLVRKTNGQF
ncbi:MAG: type IX secretion system protein PorQ [Cytophagaceae bacterium]|nr:type IX secretion system protein PorQ [Cytophagaceae bacterium]MDW8456860.1 type IX secretion system protein PorQ [Cytophagaceae bacterium]